MRLYIKLNYIFVNECSFVINEINTDEIKSEIMDDMNLTEAK